MMQQRVAADKYLTSLYFALLAALASVSFSILYPGMMSWDTVQQWNEVVTGAYSDKHPPVMAWWWGLLVAYVWNDPAVLLLFHLGMFWGGVYVLGQIFGRQSCLWSLSCLALWFVPPVMGMSVVLWKDTGLAFSWFLACALMGKYYQVQRKPGKAVAALILLLLFYGTAVRYNAIAGLFPLCVWFVMCLQQAGGRGVPLLRSFLLFCGIALSVLCVSKALITQKVEQVVTLTMAVDLRAVAAYSKKTENFSGMTPDETMKAYLAMIMEHPDYFLHRRMVLFKRLLFAPREPFVWYFTDSPCALGKEHFGLAMEAFCRPTEPESLRSRVPSYLRLFARTAMYQGITWLILSLALLGTGLYYLRRREQHRLMGQVVLLNASGLMYFGAQYFFVLTNDFRYIYWPILATTCSLFLLGRFMILRFYKREQP
jgi:hypothetical protein